MAKGAEAKQKVAEKIAAAFGADYVGEVDKKHYVWTTENGERIQIAISMTCPKVPIILDTTAQTGDWNFENDTQPMATTVATPVAAVQPAEISEQEKKNIADLMQRLGL